MRNRVANSRAFTASQRNSARISASSRKYRSSNSKVRRSTNQSHINNLRKQILQTNTENTANEAIQTNGDRYENFTQQNSGFLDDIPTPEKTIESHLYKENDLPDYSPGSKRKKSERGAFARRMFNEGIYDIDGNGEVDGMTDGKLIHYYLKGKSDSKLSKRIGSGAKYDLEQIKERLDQLRSHGVLDIDNDGSTTSSDGYKAYWWIQRYD